MNVVRLVGAHRTSLHAARARAAGAGFAPPPVLSGGMDDVPNGFDVTAARFRVVIERKFLTGAREGRSLSERSRNHEA